MSNCKHQKKLDELWNKISSDEDYYNFTQTYCKLHGGRDYCTCQPNIKQQTTVELSNRLIELQNEYAEIELELNRRTKVEYRTKTMIRPSKQATETQAEYRKRYQKAYQEHYKQIGRRQIVSKRHALGITEPIERKQYEKFTK